ncbi:late embryogenesis abundant protein [Salix suchowensis]|nr:late embryogenesis abundant protein [Salix suchowensis]
MSGMQQSFNAGQTKGNTQAKVEQWTDTIQDTADAACRDRTSPGAHSTSDSSQLDKDHSAGFLQQTGEQVKHVAQDAMDSVKNTLGVGQSKK